MYKVYFSGSIRGGRKDAELYHRIINFINQTDKVLTEHIGSPHLSQHESSLSDASIFKRDVAMLHDCDIVIAECTNPSLGVGYELALAEALGKPCHVFFNQSQTHLSAMIAGNSYFHLHPYINETDIYPILSALLAKTEALS